MNAAHYLIQALLVLCCLYRGCYVVYCCLEELPAVSVSDLHCPHALVCGACCCWVCEQLADGVHQASFGYGGCCVLDILHHFLSTYQLFIQNPSPFIMFLRSGELHAGADGVEVVLSVVVIRVCACCVCH